MTTLNQAQKRAVTNRLRALEQMVYEFERLPSRDEIGILWRLQTHLTADQHRAFQALFEQVRAEIRILADEFELEAERSDSLRILRAEASVLWADLIDLEPAKLRNYGAVAPGLDATLGPHVERLISLTAQVYAMADRALETKAKSG